MGSSTDYLTSGSGLGNIYINAKWLFKLSGMYQLPGDVNVSAFFNARQGYPFEQGILVPARATGGGQPTVLLQGVGDSRLPTYDNLDLHVERPIKLGAVHFVPAIDVFNVTNSNIVQAFRSTQNATNANNIQAAVAPRILRIGIRLNW